MGRKRISDGRVSVRLTVEQRAKLEQLAGGMGKSATLSTALRVLIDGQAIREPRSDLEAGLVR